MRRQDSGYVTGMTAVLIHNGTRHCSNWNISIFPDPSDIFRCSSSASPIPVIAVCRAGQQAWYATEIDCIVITY